MKRINLIVLMLSLFVIIFSGCEDKIEFPNETSTTYEGNGNVTLYLLVPQDSLNAGNPYLVRVAIDSDPYHYYTIELTGNYQDVDNSNFSFILQSGGNGIGRLYNWLITFKNVPSGERSVYLELFNLNNNEDAPQNIFIKNGSVLSGQTVSLGYVDLSGTVEL